MIPTKICAGIVSYNPELASFQENLRAVRGQVPLVILVDNNSTNSSGVKSLVNQFPDIQLMQNTENVGLAAALNQIVRRSVELGYTHVLLLDQDSLVSPNILAEFSRYIDEMCAIMSPLISDRNKLERIVQPKTPSESVTRPITSGSLINTSIWIELGGFDSTFFIEFIDYEYAERCIESGYKVLRVNTTTLLQEGGHAEPCRIISGITRNSSGKLCFKHPYRYNYRPERYYYRFRNNLYFLRRYGISRNSFHHECLLFMKNLIHDSLLEQNRLANWKQIIRGIRDGATKYQERRDWAHWNE